MSGAQRNYPTQSSGASGTANITGGQINNTQIGNVTPSTIVGTTIEATTAVISSEIGQDILSLLTIPAGPGTIATQTYATTAAAAAKTGGAITLALIHTVGAISVNADDYIGPGSSSGGANPTAASVVPVVFQAAGTLLNLRAQSTVSATSNTALTVYKSAGGNSLSYSATTLTGTIASGEYFCEDKNAGHAVTINANDCVVVKVGASWLVNGLHVVGQFIPASA